MLPSPSVKKHKQILIESQVHNFDTLILNHSNIVESFKIYVFFYLYKRVGFYHLILLDLSCNAIRVEESTS